MDCEFKLQECQLPSAVETAAATTGTASNTETLITGESTKAEVESVTTEVENAMTNAEGKKEVFALLDRPKKATANNNESYPIYA